MNTEQCNGCYFWRSLHGTGATAYKDKCCHYLLITGERRKRDGDKCLSRRRRRGGRKNATD